MDRLKLLQLLDTHFDQEELYELCFALSIDEENLPGDTRRSRASSLIKEVAKNGRLPDLLQLAQQIRLQAAWTEIVGTAAIR